MIWNPVKPGSRLPEHVGFALLASQNQICLVARPPEGWKPIFGFDWWLALPQIPFKPTLNIVPDCRS